MSRVKYFLLTAAFMVLAFGLAMLILWVNPGQGERDASSGETESTLISLSTGESSIAGDMDLEESVETRGVWLSIYEWQTYTIGKDEAGFREAFGEICRECREFGLNTLFAQVRAFDDAMYPSQYFPWSQYASGTFGEAPDYDPLELMVEIAHDNGLELHAWINPYRIRSSDSIPLAEGYSAAQWTEAENGYVLSYGSGLYYNPAVPEVRELILSGVEEILEGYQVDGIHFDDYFYPTVDPAFDLDFYTAYQQEGGSLSQTDWRKENVNQLVRETYRLVKSYGEDLRFGISPAGNLAYNQDTLSADVALWCSEDGYIDYICPQLYFGFENDTVPFAESVQKWSELVTNEKVKLYVGLGPYKIGALDKWAGEGQEEWMNHTDILSRQLQCIRELPNYSGFSLFRYASLFSPEDAVRQAVETEKENFYNLLTEEQNGESG